MRWFRISMALLAVFAMARLGVSLLDAVCPPAFGQAEDVHSRDAERERLQKLIETMKKKSPGAQPAPAQTETPGPAVVPTASACTEAEMAEAVAKFSMPLPDGLATIVVDGRKLPIKNPGELVRKGGFRHPALFLPKGTHFVQFRDDESLGILAEKGADAKPTPIVKDDFFSQWYAGVRAKFTGPEALGKLGANLWEAKWDFQSPMTPHLMGNYYFAQGKFKAAERKYWQAIRENPCFALAHLNLACIYARHSDGLGRTGVDFKRRAAEELHWAEQFDVGDVFGVQKAIGALRDELKLAPLAEAPALRFEDYRSADTMEARDLRAVGIFDAAMKYLRTDVERAKLMNNKAVYFKLKHKYDSAIDAYNDALRALGTSRDEPVATQILDNAASLCTAQWGGGDEEYRIYKEFMEKSWRDGRK